MVWDSGFGAEFVSLGLEVPDFWGSWWFSGLQGSACRFPGRRLQSWGIKAGFVELYSLVAGCKAAT